MHINIEVEDKELKETISRDIKKMMKEENYSVNRVAYEVAEKYQCTLSVLQKNGTMHIYIF